TIDAIGSDVDGALLGLRVVGQTGPSLGAHAEYVCVAWRGTVAPIGPPWSDAEAVAVTDGAMTALPFLREHAHLRAGQRLLVNGASGSVGSAAVQIGASIGAHVTGVCSTANVDLVASLGADVVVDHTATDFTRDLGAQRFDVVFDAVGTRRYRDCRRVLTPAGRYLTTVPTPGALWHTVSTAMPGGRRAKIAFTGLSMSRERLRDVLELASSGALRPVIDRTYTLDEIGEAHRYVDTRRKRGTVVVTL
ncbi:MAG TPA: NAD(P)-dependent alcohol dehydrogenase, partial [Egicoccus sp.]